jgi:glycosyltransferase involved in cell wall biosynthesis
LVVLSDFVGMMEPSEVRISVIMPSFNSGTFLEAALRSVLDQSPPPHEIIVQDGGSTDRTLDILRLHGDPVRWRSEPDRGQSDALNRAIKRSTGDVLLWLNADDLLAPGAIGAAIDVLRIHPEADFVYGDFDMVAADGRTLRRYRSSPYDADRVFLRGCYIFSGAIFYRRELLDRIGPFDENLHACMDFDYLLRLRTARAVHAGVTVAAFRMSGEGKSSSMRSRFLRESHTVRWRAATGSIRLQLLTLALDAWSVVLLWTQPLRLTRAWSAVRTGKRL